MQENTKSVVVKMTARRCFRTEPIWQYDVGHELTFEGFDLPASFEVHFSRSPMGKAIPQVGTNGVCTVPDMYTQSAGVIYAWLYIADTETGLTKYSIEIPVQRRAKPTNQVPTPVEQSAIDQAIAALNAGVEAAEDAQEAAEAAQASAESYAESAGQSAITATNAATAAAASAGNAAASATSAASSATDANASRQAAGLSATNAGISERNAAASATAAAGSATSAAASASQASGSATAASGSASTASTKAGEAAQSATAAAGSAASASEDAGTASTAATAAETSATAAAGSATAAAGSATSAGQSATAAAGSAAAAQEVLESIPEDYTELTEDVDSLKSAFTEHEEYAEDTYAKQDGYYQDMAVGTAEQLVSSKFVEDQEPYTLRASGGSADIGNRENLTAIVGGTVAWNQAVRDEASENSTDFAPIVTVTDAVEDAAGVKVKLEPVQDLHGYDHPWPAGGGRNTAEISIEPFVSAGVTISASNNIVLINGTKIGGAYKDIPFTLNAGTYYVKAFILGGTVSIEHPDIYIFDGTSNLTGSLYGNETSFTIESDAQLYVRLALWHDNAVYTNYKIGIVVSKTASISSFTPYSNICPITGWDAVKVTVSPTTDAEDGQTYSITLPTEAGTVYGGELTVNADGSGSLVVDRAKKILNGTEPYGTSSYASNENYAHIILADMNYSKQNQGAIMCDKLPMNSSAPYFNNGVGVWQGGSYVWYICVKKEWLESDNSAGMLSWISSNRPEAVYYFAEPQTFTLTPTEIRTLLGENNVWSDAGQTALTYTGTDEHLTLESGKKYLSRISGTDSMLLGSGQEITAAKGTDNVFDLTQMFGTAVADYVYGQGAGFFRRWFGKQWYPYNVGELKHVEGLQSHDMVGFNAWDEEVRHGYYNEQTGAFVESSAYCANKNPIPAFPNTVYYGTEGLTYVDTFLCYDSRMNYLGTAIRNADNTRTTRPNTAFINFRTRQAYGGTYHHDICISLAHNNSRNGEYEPYEKHSYPLDSTVILRGIPKVGANGVYWDGDRYLPDGTVERRYGVVDLGTLNWTYQQANLRCWSDGINTLVKKPSGDWGSDLICPAYRSILWSSTEDKFISLANTGRLFVKDTVYTDAAAFKSAMQGVLLVYELATPTTETADPYRELQIVDDWGTEEFVTDGLVPVGHETQYPANLRDKLQHLPDLASSNGIYIVKQTDSEMELMRLPDMPTANGNYRLKLNVASGSPTFSWEVVS